VLSLSANPARDWAELRQAALDRLKEENAALLQRLSALQAFGTHRAPPATDTAGDRSSTTTELVPRASWAGRLSRKSSARGRAALEGKAHAAPQAGVRRKDGRVPRGTLGDPRRQGRILR
jgi:hypothetical protein